MFQLIDRLAIYRLMAVTAVCGTKRLRSTLAFQSPVTELLIGLLLMIAGFQKLLITG